MRILRAAVVLFVVVVSSAAQTPDALLSDTRLTVHTLLREDVFAGSWATIWAAWRKPTRTSKA